MSWAKAVVLMKGDALIVPVGHPEGEHGAEK
jgi:hypothetical protein